MLDLTKVIQRNKLFSQGDVVAVACSGGIDSMTLLHYLNKNKDLFGIKIMAVNIDHKIREESAKDSAFVMNYCKKNGIKCQKFVVDALALVKEQKLSVEEAARNARYGVFDSLLQKGIVNKFAIAHHSQDQVETILLNLFRGAGVRGARGMELVRGKYVRPMLFTNKSEILEYAKENNIPYVVDETNGDSKYSRNFIRNEVVPTLADHWPNIEQNILNFSRLCKQDDDYIYSQIDFDSLVLEKDLVKIPLSSFIYPAPIAYRLVRTALEHLLATKDMEKKHIDIIRSLALEGENGTKLSLPNNITCHKEYDYITVSIVRPKPPMQPKKFKVGTINLDNYGKLIIQKAKNFEIEKGKLKFDSDKLPKDCIIRAKEEGDIFTPYGSGTKKLKDYFIDKKIPARIRQDIPVIASGNEVYVVVGVEISDDVKIDKDTTSAYSVEKI